MAGADEAFGSEAFNPSLPDIRQDEGLTVAHNGVVEYIQLPPMRIDLEKVIGGFIRQAYDNASGNQSAAARQLGMTRYAFRYQMAKHGVGDLTLDKAGKRAAVKS